MEREQITPNERLQLFRKEKKMSGEAFGELIGLTKSGLSNVENGRAKVSIEYLDILINKFPDLNIYWLISGKGEMYAPAQVGNNPGTSEATNCWELLKREEEQHNKLKEDYQQLKSLLRKD